MHKYTFRPFFAPIYIWPQPQNKQHTLFFPGLRTTTRQQAYLRLAIFQPYANASSHTDSMNELQYGKVAKSTSIRTRFKILTSIEQAKLRILNKSFVGKNRSIYRGKKSKGKFYFVLILSVGIP